VLLDLLAGDGVGLDPISIDQLRGRPGAAGGQGKESARVATTFE
jgi:hypothetical protein